MWRKKTERIRVLVAKQNKPKKIIGLIAFEAFIDGNVFGYVHLLAVTHERRREGIATALKQAALDQTATDGCIGMESKVALENIPMQQVNKYWTPEIEPSEEIGGEGFLKTVIPYEQEI